MWIKMTKIKKNIILDEYESEILEAFENGELHLVEPKTDFKTIARNTMKKTAKPI